MQISPLDPFRQLVLPAGSMRLKLLKIGAVVTVSVRRIKIAFACRLPDEGAVCSRA